MNWVFHPVEKVAQIHASQKSVNEKTSVIRIRHAKCSLPVTAADSFYLSATKLVTNLLI